MADESVSVMLTALRETDDDSRIALISSRIRSALNEDRGRSQSALMNLFERSISSIQDASFGKVVSLGYLTTRMSIHESDSGITRVSFGLAYLQDHSDSDPNLDERVIRHLSDDVLSFHLDGIVSDVCVNDLQWSSSNETT